MKVVPIDIDPVGWSEVPEGKHNAWGVVSDNDELIVARKTRDAAEEKMAAIARGDA